VEYSGTLMDAIFSHAFKKNEQLFILRSGLESKVWCHQVRLHARQINKVIIVKQYRY